VAEDEETVVAGRQGGAREARVAAAPKGARVVKLKSWDASNSRKTSFFTQHPESSPDTRKVMSTATNGTQVKGNPWDMTVGGGGGGGDYVCCPPGNFPGAIVAMFDVGFQPEKDMKTGTMTERRKLVMVFELNKKQPDGKPFVLAKKYTWSMNEKSNFYKDVVNITGARFKEGEKFNPLSLVSVPVMVNVTNTSNGEKTYHDISSVSQYPEGFPTPPEPTHEALAWSVMTGDPIPAGLEWVPFVYGKSIQALAEESAEWKKKANPAAATGNDDDPPY
jgi:hypothetical protein